MVELRLTSHPTTRGPIDLAVEEIGSLEAMDGLGREWDDLLRQSPDMHLSLTRPWLRAWWQSFGAGASLRLLVVRHGLRLVGVAPLLARRELSCGIPCRVVRFISNRFVPWCDFVCDPEVPRAAFLRAVFVHLARAPRKPDLIFLRNVPRGSGTIDCLKRAVSGNAVGFRLKNPTRSPLVPIEGTWDAYLASFSGRSRKTISKAFKALDDAGLRFEEARQGGRSGEILEAGLRLEATGWKGEKGSAILRDTSVAAFHRSIAATLPDVGQYGLWHDGRMIAWDFCVYDDGLCYALKTAYDESLGKLAPGMLIQLLELRQLFTNRSVRAFDQLSPETEYKARWARDYRPQVNACIYGQTPAGRALHVVDVTIRAKLSRVGWLRRAKSRLERD